MTRFRREPLTLFATCGMALWGDPYVPQMSKALGVAERSIQRWSSGARDVPPDIWENLLGRLREEERFWAETADAVERLLKEMAA